MTPVDSIEAARLPPGTEALATLTRGDSITEVNGDSLKSWEDLEEWLLHGKHGKTQLRLRVAKRAEPLVINLPADTTLRHQLVGAVYPPFPARSGPASLGQPALPGGLKGRA